MKRILLFAGWLFVLMSMTAQEVGGYTFLDIPVSAHASALGGPVISVVDPEPSLSEYNASLLCDEMNQIVSFSYMNWLSDIHLGNVSYSGKFLQHGTWQGGLRYVNYGNFDGYDEWGNSTGSFSAQDLAFSGSVGYPISAHWRIGGSLRAIYSKYEIESAFALGVDLGLNYYDKGAGRSVSFAVTNLGGQLKKMGDRHISMPTRLMVGITKEVEHLPFAFTLTGLDLLNWDDTNTLDHLLFSAEWIATQYFYVAAGYNYRRQHEFQGSGGFLRGLSLGIGFQWEQWQMSCSYARYNAVDGSLHLELNYHF